MNTEAPIPTRDPTRDLDPAKMVGKILVCYLLSPEGQRAALLLGKDAARLQTFVLDLEPSNTTDIERELWAHWAQIDEDGIAVVHVPPPKVTGAPAYKRTSYRFDPATFDLDVDRSGVVEYLVTVQFDAPRSPAQLQGAIVSALGCSPRDLSIATLTRDEHATAYLASRRIQIQEAAAWVASLSLEERGSLPPVAALEERIASGVDPSEALREAKEAVDTHRQHQNRLAETECTRLQMRAWIESHGSAHLKDCLSLGLSCAVLYAKERLAAEAPEWVPCSLFRARPNIHDVDNPTREEVRWFTEALRAEQLRPDPERHLEMVLLSGSKWIGVPETRGSWRSHVVRLRVPWHPEDLFLRHSIPSGALQS